MFGSILGGFLGGLGSLFGGDATSKAAAANTELLKNLRKDGLGYIDTGQQQASGYLGDVNDLWKKFSDQTGGFSGLNMLGDALGLNGADGSSRAASAFQTSPGYDFQMNQGLDALERRAAAQGRLSSGQTSLDTLNFASGLANSEYQNWLKNLSGFGGTQANLYTTGTTGQAGSLSDLANLATGTAGQKVNLISDITNGMMGANNQKAAGTQQSLNSLGGFGQALGGMFGGYL